MTTLSTIVWAVLDQVGALSRIIGLMPTSCLRSRGWKLEGGRAGGVGQGGGVPTDSLSLLSFLHSAIVLAGNAAEAAILYGDGVAWQAMALQKTGAERSCRYAWVAGALRGRNDGSRDRRPRAGQWRSGEAGDGRMRGGGFFEFVSYDDPDGQVSDLGQQGDTRSPERGVTLETIRSA